MICDCDPSFFGLGLEDGHVQTFGLLICMSWGSKQPKSGKHLFLSSVGVK